MDPIIDVAQDVSKHAAALAQAGVKTVIRYYNHRNSSVLPTKCLTKGEAEALHAVGISVAVVFQARGGAEGHIEDLTAATGTRDATRALALAEKVGQPEGSAIYFAVDHDYVSAAHLASIKAYFTDARTTLDGRYKVGVYGSGAVCGHVHDLVDYKWLAGAMGWRGTRPTLDLGDYTIFQSRLNAKSDLGFFYDGNKPASGVGDFGQWPVMPVAGPAVLPGPELRANVVAEIQRALNLYAAHLGFVPLRIDGIPGPKTRAALAKAGL